MPAWVQDEKTWSRAKEEAGPKDSIRKRDSKRGKAGTARYPTEDDYWATVTHIYKQMGGGIGKEAMSLQDRLVAVAGIVEARGRGRGPGKGGGKGRGLGPGKGRGDGKGPGDGSCIQQGLTCPKCGHQFSQSEGQSGQELPVAVKNLL